MQFPFVSLYGSHLYHDSLAEVLQSRQKDDTQLKLFLVFFSKNMLSQYHVVWCAKLWAFFAKYSVEKTKPIDVSQPPNQGDERNWR